MDKNFLNLYKITLSLKEREFTRFEPKTLLDKRTSNRVRHKLFDRYDRPVIQRDGHFLVFGKIEKEENISIALSEDEIVVLQNVGIEKLQELSNEEEVQQFIRDVVAIEKTHKNFAEDYIKKEKEKTKVEWKLGGITLTPYLINRVFKKGKDFFLMLDFHFRFILNKNLQQLLEEGKVSPSDLKRFKLKPRNQDFIGEYVDAKMAEELGRDFIESMYQKSSKNTQKYWEKILKEEKLFKKAYVVFLKDKEKTYTYPASMLLIVIDFETIEEENVASNLVNKLKLDPQKRIDAIREALGRYNSVLGGWGVEINSEEEEVDGKIPYNYTLIDANGQISTVESNMRKFLEGLKPFVKSPNLSALILTIDKENNKSLNSRREELITELQKFLENKGINLNTKEIKRIVAKNRMDARKELMHFVKGLERERYDLVIVFLEEYKRVDPYTEEILLYDYIKKELLSYMIPSQVILNTTLKKTDDLKYIVLNVAEQIMAKTGNVPYKISGEIGGADYFLGVDLSRITRRSTINEAAFTKIFARDGTFLRYILLREPTFGESLSERTIDYLFEKLYRIGIKGGSRLVIHRDGRFRGKEVNSFVKFAKEFNYEVELVEIIKRQNPRVFSKKDERMIKGDFYKLDENTLILATYNNIYRGTHQPIRIHKVYGRLSIETLASQVLSLTLMNYSSFQPIKLPATIHYADKIAKLLLREIKPREVEGDIMYWL